MSSVNYRSVMWDLDGCLLDSRPGLVEAMCRTFAKYEVEYEESELFSTIGISWVELFPDKYGMPEELVGEAVDYCIQTYMQGEGMRNTKAFEGIVPLLSDIHQNNVPQFVVTAKPDWQAKEIITAITSPETSVRF